VFWFRAHLKGEGTLEAPLGIDERKESYRTLGGEKGLLYSPAAITRRGPALAPPSGALLRRVASSSQSERLDSLHHVDKV
jgi:hypothetical protein